MGLFGPKIYKPENLTYVPPPKPSGVHGTQKLARTDMELRAAGLLGHGWGKGIPVLESVESGKILRYRGENSLVCFGPPGSGKFTDLQARCVVECAATRSQLIIDASGGQIAAGTLAELRKHATVFVFSPTSEGLPPGVAELLGPSRSYNAMETLLDPASPTYGVQCEGAAEMVVSDSEDVKEGGFFSGRARALVSGVIMYLRQHGKPEQQNLAEVARIILTRQIFAFARDVVSRPETSRFVKDRLGPYAALTAVTDRTIQSILQTADEGLSFLSNEAISKVVRLSSVRFENMKHGPRPTVVIVTMPVTMLRKCRGWFGMLISSAIQELNSTPRGHWPVLITVDECGILPRQPLIEQAYAESRKRGVQLFCFFQHTGQVLEIYGESGLKNFESGSDVLLYLPPRDLDTAKYVSERAGYGTAVLPHYSYPKNAMGEIEQSLSYGEQAWPVLTPQQVMSLGRNRAVMFCANASNALLVGRRPYFDRSLRGGRREEHARLRRLIASDPYHKGRAE